MNIVLYGATGKAGSRILKELLSRGHQVKAVVRDPSKIGASSGLKIEKGDLNDTAKIAKDIRGTDAVVSSYGPPVDSVEELVGVTERLVDAVKQAGVPRLLMVGGAGSLEVAPGVQLIDSGHLPEAWLPIAKAHRTALDVLKQSEIDWTNLSPAAFFEPGERTGKYRSGTNELISNAEGKSTISMEDFAIAVADELEHPKHHRARFSVGY